VHFVQVTCLSKACLRSFVLCVACVNSRTKAYHTPMLAMSFCCNYIINIYKNPPPGCMHTQHWARFMLKVQTNVDSFSLFKRNFNFCFNFFLKAGYAWTFPRGILKEPLVPVQGLNYDFDKTFNPILNLVFHNQP
jgi:hypothetical protein